MCAQPEVFVPPPTPQVPVLRTHRMFVAGETVTFTLAE
jgi:hypothetical protein